MFVYKTANTHIRNRKRPIIPVMEPAPFEFSKNKIINMQFFLLLFFYKLIYLLLFKHPPPPRSTHFLVTHTHTHIVHKNTYLTFINWVFKLVF